MDGGGAEREGDTESEAGFRLWAVRTEPDMGLEPTDWEIMTWAKIGHLTDWATQAPWTCPSPYLPSIKSYLGKHWASSTPAHYLGVLGRPPSLHCLAKRLSNAIMFCPTLMTPPHFGINSSSIWLLCHVGRSLDTVSSPTLIFHFSSSSVILAKQDLSTSIKIYLHINVAVKIFLDLSSPLTGTLLQLL